MTSNEANRNTASIIIFGEVLFDCFPDGHRVLGGAPFNVAWSLCGFGRNPLFVSSVGEDEGGLQVKSQMNDFGLSLSGLQAHPGAKTGEVHVTIEDNEPTYEICERRAWDYIEDQQFYCGDLLYHGLLALRNDVSHQTLSRVVERSEAQRFFDINLRPPYVDTDILKYWMQGTDWLKLNIDELRALLDDPEIPFAECNSQIDQLRDQYSIKNVILTGGRDGAILSGDYGHAHLTPAPEPESFVDTVGAGDAFSAAAIDGILSNLPAEQVVRKASQFAARVCGLRGATTLQKTFYEIKTDA